MSLTISPWKYGKEWVYSITYDEALSDLHRFAVPLHEELGIPGHVEAVAGHIGKVRQLGSSSYNGFKHMGPEELRDLVARGWGVGNHSWSHEVIRLDTVDRELRQARDVLEEAIGQPVPLYCSPGSNVNMAEHVLEAARRLGYLGAMSLTDAPNRPGEELFWLNRTPLLDQSYEPFFSEFDPYRSLRQARAVGGWIIDYCHCPLEQPVHRQKDCSAAQLRQRLEAVLSEGGDRVWCADPDEVAAYHAVRRAATVEAVRATPEEHVYRLRLGELPSRVTARALTLEAEVPAAWCRMPRAWLDGSTVSVELARPRRLRLTTDVWDGMEVRFRKRG